MNYLNYGLAGFLALGLGLSGVMGCQPADLGSSETPVFSSQVLNYQLTLTAIQRLEQVPASLKQALEAQIQDYEAALSSGKVEAYYHLPNLSWALTPGEGFTPQFLENIREVSLTGLVHAQALIFKANSRTPQVLRGQYLGGRFYFSGPEKLTLAATDQVYLLFLSLELQPLFFQGKLSSGKGLGPDGKAVPDDLDELSLDDFLASELLAGSEGSYFNRSDLPEDLEARLKQLIKASTYHAQHGDAYQAQVRQLRLVPPPTEE